jgi:hypothetical protein
MVNPWAGEPINGFWVSPRLCLGWSAKYFEKSKSVDIRPYIAAAARPKIGARWQILGSLCAGLTGL